MGRIVIFGAGAIGGTVGGRLALAGVDVVLIARAAHATAIRKHGLRFVTPSGVNYLHLPAVTQPQEAAITPDDRVFLCMKGQDTEAALRDMKTVIADAPVFCLQNGVRNEEIASRYYRQVYGVMVHVGGTYLTPGEVTSRSDPPGNLVIGCYPSGQDALAAETGELLRRAGFRVMITGDIMPYKWGKLMSNLANGIVAATNGQDPGGRIAAAIRAEAAALLQQAGQRWVAWDDVKKEWPPFAEPYRAEVQAGGHGSTWQSLARAEGTVEVEFLNGEIVRLARRLGKDAPLNAALQRVVEDMAAKGQRPGAYTPEALARALGIP